MRYGYADSDLGQIHYFRVGSGAPLVLLNQSGRSSHMHRGLAAALAEKHDVIALDLPGTGGSAALRRGTSFESIAQAFLQVLRTLDVGEFDLYGIHTGNKIGAAMAVIGKDSVRKFVFVGQSHSIVPDQAKRNATISQAVTNIGGGGAGYYDTLMTWTSKVAEISSFTLSKPVLDDLMETNRYDGALDWLIDDLQAMRSRPALYESNFAYDLGRDLQALSAPTLVLEIVTALEDRTIGRQGRAILSLLKNGQLHEIEESDGHGLTLENRVADVAALVNAFLDR